VRGEKLHYVQRELERSYEAVMSALQHQPTGKKIISQLFLLWQQWE